MIADPKLRAAEVAAEKARAYWHKVIRLPEEKTREFHGGQYLAIHAVKR